MILLALAAQLAFVHLYEQALEARVKEFGDHHPKVGRAAVDLGLYLRENKENQRAAAALGRALSIDERAYGPESAIVAEDLEHLASVSHPAPHLERAISIREKTGPRHRLSDDLAALAEHVPPPRAVELTKRALALRGNDLKASLLRNNLGLLLQESKPAAAEAYFRTALQAQRKLAGPAHPETATTMNNLASLLLTMGRIAEAERLQRQALKTFEETFGEVHARTAIACSNLADIVRTRGAFAEAEKLYRRTIAIDERLYGPQHPEVAADRQNLQSLLEQSRSR